MCFRKINKLLLIGFYSIILAISGEPITKSGNLNSITILDSSSAGTWSVTSDALEPEDYYNSWIRGEDRVQWKPYNVPGDINNIFPTPWKIGFKVFVKKEIELTGDLQHYNTSIRLGAISDRDRVYFNGILIGSTGKFDSDKPEGYDKVRMYSIPDNLIHRNQKNLLLVEIQSYFESFMGIHQDELEIGPTDLLYSRLNQQEMIKVFFISIYLTIGIVFLFIFFNSRKDYEYLFFSLFLFLFSLFQILRTQAVFSLGIDYYLIKEISFSTVPLLFPLLSHFFISYFKIPYKNYHKLLDAVILSISFLFLFTFDFRLKDKITGNFLVYLYLIYMILYLFWVIGKARTKNKDAVYMLIGVTAIIVSTIIDIMSSYSLIIFPKITGFFFLFFIIGLATVLGNNIIRMKEEIQDLNLHLEEKVYDRTMQLESRTEELAKKNIEAKELLHILCHDLTNPISAAYGMVTFVNTLDEFEELKPGMKSSLENGLNIIELVRKMRALEEKKAELIPGYILFNEILEESKSIIRDKFDKKKIQLIVSTPSDLKVYVEKSSFINSVLNNLLTNAVKFSFPGSKIFITSESLSEGVINLSITDNGIGIPPKMLLNLFDMSKPTSRPGTDGESGTGFGMPLVKKFVEFCGGKIQIISKDIKTFPDEHGTTVILTLKAEQNV